MKLGVLFTATFLLTLYSCILPSSCIMEDAILKFLEELRARMCHSIPKFGLPALDPLHVRHVEYNINNKYIIDFTGSWTNLNLTGLSDFIINDLKITTVPLRRSSLSLTMPLTALNSLYTAKGSLAYILNLAGDGKAEARVKDFSLGVSWIFKTGVSLGIRSLKITIKIGEIFVDFEQLIEDERVDDFLHALINELGLELLDDVWKAENRFVEQLFEKKIDSFLGQYTIADIIKIINGGGEGPIFGPDDPPPDCKTSF